MLKNLTPQIGCCIGLVHVDEHWSTSTVHELTHPAPFMRQKVHVFRCKLQQAMTRTSHALTDGEEFFRRLEKEVVLKTLDEEDSVIALGGGSVLDPDVEQRLQDFSEVIFLDVSISNAAPRVGFNKERPLLMGNPRQQWLALMEKRRPIYERISARIVSTDNRKPQEVAREIAQMVIA